MDKKNDQIYGFDYPDLDSLDQQDQNKQQNQPSGDPVKKTKIDQSIQKNNQAQTKSSTNNPINLNLINTPKMKMPFFPPPPPGSQNKSTTPWIPPPPMNPASKQNNNNNKNYNNFNQKSNYGHNKNYDANRDKKTIVYVKNIPKSYNTQQKLMTFFKNEGVIKQIKVNDVQQSAVIKFLKEQNATKFLKSNKIIFNRSYIVYGQRQNIPVTQQQVNDRINDEQGILKKAQQTNLKVVKQKVSNQISQQIRAIYFLQNNLIDDQDPQTINLKQQILRQKQTKISIKRSFQNQKDQSFDQQNFKQNLYDWSLTFNRKASSLQKKSLFAQFLKYGPIINLQFQCLSEIKTNTQFDSKVEGEQIAPLNDYKIKILFLSLKNAWTVYSTKKQQLNLTVQGKQMKKYFESGKLKKIQIKKLPENLQGNQIDNQDTQTKNILQDQQPEQVKDSIEALKVKEEQILQIQHGDQIVPP